MIAVGERRVRFAYGIFVGRDVELGVMVVEVEYENVTGQSEST